MNILGVIPSRYASTRFPGKPLIDIDGQLMIERVYKQVKKALDYVVVATDDERIVSAVESFGGIAIMTSTSHQSGTDRCAEAVTVFEENSDIKIDVVLNIQGDEPLIDPQQVTQVAQLFDESSTSIATLVKSICDYETLFDENKTRVIINNKAEAIYFSRHAIPFIKGVAKTEWLQHQKFYSHIGLYGYKKEVLNQLVQLEQSCLEKMESLEQLRWIENGFIIKTSESNISGMSIDTPEDLKNILEYIKGNKHLEL